MKGHYYGQNQAKKLIDTLNNIIFLLTGKQEGQKQTNNVNSANDSKSKQNIDLLDMVSMIVYYIRTLYD